MEDHTPGALESAKRLRKTMSLPEVLLWRHLRGKPMGVKFRKQHPVGNFVVDFYCATKRVAVEIDGIVHDMGNRPAHDAKRDAWLLEQGIEVVRFPASEILREAAEVAESIVKLCADRPPPSTADAVATSPTGGGFTGVSA